MGSLPQVSTTSRTCLPNSTLPIIPWTKFPPLAFPVLRWHIFSTRKSKATTWVSCTHFYRYRMDGCSSFFFAEITKLLLTLVPSFHNQVVGICHPLIPWVARESARDQNHRLVDQMFGTASPRYTPKTPMLCTPHATTVAEC